MATRSGNLLIAQGGGPTAVINASLTAAVLEALEHLSTSSRVWGALGGITGLLEEDLLDLRSQSRSTWEAIRSSPAAALGSCRKKMSPEDVETAVEICKKRDIRYFFYIGGNDSMDTASKMSKASQSLGYEMYTAGIPKTVDNDLPETDFCPGYGSCASFIAQATADLGMDIRSLPTPVSVMEVIGRNAGWTAASSILARKRPGDAPHLIYVPEVPFSRQRFLASVEQVYSQYGWVVVVVSEGLLDEKGDPIGQSGDETIKDGFGHRLAGEVGASLAQLVSQEIGLRARSEKPGLIARASSLHVSKVDRNAAEGVGRFAVRNVCQGSTDFMAAICRDNDEPLEMSYIGVPLEKTANFERLLPNCYISESKSDIEDSFRSYVRPLIGQALTRHPSLIE